MANTSADVLAQGLLNAINKKDAKKTSGYDTQAEIKNIKDGVAWVHIPGGIDETPVALTINAEIGDIVQVRVAGGRAWITGNATNPPTDDKRANVAYGVAINASEHANIAAQAATSAQVSAMDAQNSATTASKAADNAVKGLAQVEDVVGVVNWMRTHGEYTITEDTTPQESVKYYTTSVVSNPEGNPRELMYYELSDGVYSLTLDTTVKTGKTYYILTEVTPPSTANPHDLGYVSINNMKDVVADYVNLHLALLGDGLHVLAGTGGWQVRIDNDSVDILDPDENVVAVYSSAVRIGKIEEQHVDINPDSTVYYNEQQQPVAEISQKIYSVTDITATPNSLQVDSSGSIEIPIEISPSSGSVFNIIGSVWAIPDEDPPMFYPAECGMNLTLEPVEGSSVVHTKTGIVATYNDNKITMSYDGERSSWTEQEPWDYDGSSNNYLLEKRPITDSVITFYCSVPDPEVSSYATLNFTAGTPDRKVFRLDKGEESYYSYLTYDGNTGFILESFEFSDALLTFRYTYKIPFYTKLFAQYKGIAKLPYYTFGSRIIKSPSDLGFYSFAQGNEVQASGENSSAFGLGSFAKSNNSMALGMYNSDITFYHAKSAGTTTETFETSASSITFTNPAIDVTSVTLSYPVGGGSYSFLSLPVVTEEEAEEIVGDSYFVMDNLMMGLVYGGSIVLNETFPYTRVKVVYDYVTDESVGVPFIIGNGDDDENRNNALAVDWTGDVFLDLDVSATYVDEKITDALEGLQLAEECITNDNMLDTKETISGILEKLGSLFTSEAGVIKMFAGSTPPTGWLKCNGQAVSRTTYATLFAVIRETYGAGDGNTTFNLPDLRGRFPLGIGNGTASGHTNHTLGQKGGNENLIVPSHDHSIPGNWSTGSGSSTGYMTSTNRSTTTRRTGDTGSSATGANMPPYIGLNFIICTGEIN